MAVALHAVYALPLPTDPAHADPADLMLTVLGDDATSVLATHVLARARLRPRLLTASPAAARAAEHLALPCRPPADVGRRHDQRACLVFTPDALDLAAALTRPRGTIVLSTTSPPATSIATLAAFVEHEITLVPRSPSATLPLAQAHAIARTLDPAPFAALLPAARAA